MPANTDDFFGEGTATPAQAPAAPQDPDDLPNPANPGGISNNELRRRQTALSTSGAFTSGINQHGSAVNQPVSADVALATSRAPIDASAAAARAPGTAGAPGIRDGSGNPTMIVSSTPAQDAAYNAKLGTVTSQGFAGGVQQLGFTPPYGASGSPSDALGSQSQTALDTGSNLAERVLGAQPTVAPEHQVTPGNRDALTPFVDPMLSSDKYTDAALAMSKDLVDRVLNTPLQTKIAGDQALSNQLALARSGRGGAGAVQDALNGAQAQAPQLLQQTQQAGIQEQVQRAGAAGQAAGIFAGVAGGVADREVRIKQANQGAGLHVLDNLTTLTGQDLQFDENQTNQIGLLARDFNAMGTAFANMDVQTQLAQWQDLTQRYGIDHNFKAQIESIAASKSIGPLDALKLALGGVSAVGGLLGAA